ncbi:hypothetical protein FQN57_002204 [Myotisia sp. PD_48]|nr:hypothetical protein FQN57_002204 [Myotisia sp. PD_48]
MSDTQHPMRDVEFYDENQLERSSDDEIGSPVSNSEPKTENSLSSEDEGEESVEEGEWDAAVLEDMRKLETYPDIAGKYRLIKRIGEGTFSTVYKAEDLLHDQYINDWVSQSDEEQSEESSNKRRRLERPAKQHADNEHAQQSKPSSRYVALKKIYVTSSPARILNELRILRDLRYYDSVCNIVTAFRCADQIIAVLPYFPHAEFRTLFRTFLVEDMRHYFHSLLTALASVHGQGIIHRDVKPTNFLYNPDLKRGLLVDFGLAEYSRRSSTPCLCTQDSHIRRETKNNSDRYTRQGMSYPVGFPKNDTRPSRRANRAGTRGFRAPEVLFKCTDQTSKIDIWSVGVILLTLLGRRFPFFHSMDDADALIEIATIFGSRRMAEAAALHAQVFETTIPTIGEKGYSLERIVQWSSCLDTLTGREKQGIRLLNHLLDLRPDHRYSAEDALEDSFFVSPKGDDLAWGGLDTQDHSTEEGNDAEDGNDETTPDAAEDVQLV